MLEAILDFRVDHGVVIIAAEHPPHCFITGQESHGVAVLFFIHIIIIIENDRLDKLGA